MPNVLIKMPRTIGAICLIPFLFSLILGAWLSQKSIALTEDGVSVTATVIEIGSRDDSDHGTTYYPIYIFTTEDGVEHTGESSASSTHCNYEVGDPIEILYLPDNPSKSQPNSFVNLWLGPLICLILAIVPLCFGLVLFFIVPRFLNHKEQAA
jgi:hypothetical protein